MAAAFIGAGLKNIFEININIFDGFFEIDVDNWGLAQITLFGNDFEFIDAKVCCVQRFASCEVGAAFLTCVVRVLG